MSKWFIIEIEETLTKKFLVEADIVEEAIEKIQEGYVSGEDDFVLDSSDFDNYELKLIQEVENPENFNHLTIVE